MRNLHYKTPEIRATDFWLRDRFLSIVKGTPRAQFCSTKVLNLPPLTAARREDCLKCPNTRWGATTSNMIGWIYSGTG